MQLKTISYDKEKERGAQIKLYRNSNEGHFQQGWEWKAWQKSKLILEELGPKEKTIPVQGTHKLKDRIGGHRDYLKIDLLVIKLLSFRVREKIHNWRMEWSGKAEVTSASTKHLLPPYPPSPHTHY